MTLQKKNMTVWQVYCCLSNGNEIQTKLISKKTFRDDIINLVKDNLPDNIQIDKVYELTKITDVKFIDIGGI